LLRKRGCYLSRNCSENLPILIEREPSRARFFAYWYIGKEDPACRLIMEKAFTYLLETDPMEAAYVAIDCKEKEDPVCQAIIPDAFDKLLEKDIYAANLFTTDCIEQNRPNCQKTIAKAFVKFFKKDPSFASFIADKCLGQKSPSCQKIDYLIYAILQPQNLLEKAFTRLTGVNLLRVKFFADYCLPNVDADPSCVQLIDQVLLPLAEKHKSLSEKIEIKLSPLQPAIARNFIKNL
jgi:hypothetical protein